MVKNAPYPMLLIHGLFAERLHKLMIGSLGAWLKTSVEQFLPNRGSVLDISIYPKVILYSMLLCCKIIIVSVKVKKRV